MASTIHELELNCIVWSENNLSTTKKASYMVTTLFHGSSKVQKHKSDLNAEGGANMKFNDVNLESDYLRFQLFNQGKWFQNKRVATINVRVSELVSSCDGNINQEGSATYEFAKSSKQHKKCDLEVQYKQSMAQEGEADAESKHVPFIDETCCNRPVKLLYAQCPSTFRSYERYISVYKRHNALKIKAILRILPPLKLGLT